MQPHKFRNAFKRRNVTPWRGGGGREGEGSSRVKKAGCETSLWLRPWGRCRMALLLQKCWDSFPARWGHLEGWPLAADPAAGELVTPGSQPQQTADLLR